MMGGSPPQPQVAPALLTRVTRHARPIDLTAWWGQSHKHVLRGGYDHCSCSEQDEGRERGWGSMGAGGPVGWGVKESFSLRMSRGAMGLPSQRVWKSLRSRTWNPGWHRLTPALASMWGGGPPQGHRPHQAQVLSPPARRRIGDALGSATGRNP